jgi:DNA-binding MarR family transcriptional regulator
MICPEDRRARDRETGVAQRSGALPREDLDVLGGYVVEEQVGFLLRRVQQRHAAIFQEGMQHADLTPTQFTALVKVVELGRTTQNHLGRLAAMDPATIQGVVRRLTARGLIRRMQDPADRRTAVLAPTPAGLALIARAVASARAITEATLAPLSANERALFLSLLRKMV